MRQPEGFPKQKPRRQLSVDWVPPWLHKAAREKSKREGVSLRALVLGWLREWVSK